MRAALWLQPAADTDHLVRGFDPNRRATAIGDAHRLLAGAAGDVQHAGAGHARRNGHHRVFERTVEVDGVTTVAGHEVVDRVIEVEAGLRRHRRHQESAPLPNVPETNGCWGSDDPVGPSDGDTSGAKSSGSGSMFA